MRMLLTIATCLLFISVSYCQCLNVVGNITCPSNCQCCKTGDTCSACEPYYRITKFTININTTNSTNTSQIITINQQISNCTRCISPNCYYCYVGSLGKQHCGYCQYNYGIQVQNDSRCNLCDQFNAYACKSINNCDALNSSNSSNTSIACSYCAHFYVNSQGRCAPCSSEFRQCFTCNQLQCTSCEQNYYLNTTNYKECVACALANCLSCQHGPLCTQCLSTFYIDASGHCLPCIHPCITCNISGCLSCNNTANKYILLSNGTCMPCYNFVNTTNCTSCTFDQSNYTCLTCIIGSFINGTACRTCSSPCLTCINSSSTCLSCINNQYILNTNSNTCDFCYTLMTKCWTCISDSVCLTCSYGFVVAILANQCTSCSQLFKNCENCTTSQCLACQPGSYMLGNVCLLNMDCNSNCLTCEAGIKRNCASCFNGYYLQTSNKSCSQCPYNCTKCLSDTYCLACIDGNHLIGSLCLPCPPGTYYLNTIHSCLNCSSFCTNCTVTGCTTCESAFFVVSQFTGQCQDLCGDGYVITLPCDGGKGVANDGCSDDCTIDPKYNCTYTNIPNANTLSNALIRKSQCYYIGWLTLSLHKALQSIFSNRVQLTFQVKPYLLGMPTGVEGQAMLRSVFQLSPLDVTTDYTISINPSEETITFEVPYSSDISNISLGFTFTSAPLLSNSMFQFVPGQSFFVEMGSITAFGRLGEYYKEDQYSVNKLIFVITIILTGISYLLLFFGLFSRQLAGLEHILLCQTIFLLVLFRPKSSFYLEGLLGLKYSISIDIFNSQASGLPTSPGSLYNINTDSFINNFNINFFLLLLPVLISPIFMFYRIKNKHLPVKKDFGKTVAELLIGQMLLYFVVFNFYGFVSYSYLYFGPVRQDQFINLALMIATAVFTLFSWSSLLFRPEAVGLFRSAFSSYKTYNHYEPTGGKLTKKFVECVSWRINGEDWKDFYRMWSINFYFILLSYQITAICFIIYSLNFGLALLQAIVLVLLIVIKPYLKPIQKFRSIFTFCILLFANLINFLPISSIAIPAFLVGLLSLHLLLTAFIVAKSSYLQFNKKCMERSEIVRKMFHEKADLTHAQHIEQQRNVLSQLIKKYHNLDLSEKPELSPGISPHKPTYDDHQEEVKQEISDHEYLLTEQRILGEENKHLRYVDGMKFIQKYGNEVNEGIIVKHYAGI